MLGWFEFVVDCCPGLDGFSLGLRVSLLPLLFLYILLLLLLLLLLLSFLLFIIIIIIITTIIIIIIIIMQEAIIETHWEGASLFSVDSRLFSPFFLSFFLSRIESFRSIRSV